LRKRIPENPVREEQDKNHPALSEFYPDIFDVRKHGEAVMRK
jgi:hypothetical protein